MKAIYIYNIFFLSQGGMSDYVIMVKDAGQLALAGQKLVKTATGEVPYVF